MLTFSFFSAVLGNFFKKLYFVSKSCVIHFRERAQQSALAAGLWSAELFQSYSESGKLFFSLSSLFCSFLG